MHVELAQERILLLSDRVTMENAKERAWAKRVEAFGAMAKLGGFLTRPKDEEFECVYQERRLQPFWRLTTHAVFAYERMRDYQIAVAPEVTEVEIAGETRSIASRHFALRGLERCREDIRRDILIDGLTGQEDPKLAAYLDFHFTVATAETLATAAQGGTVVVPPQVRASGLVRDAVAGSIRNLDADTVLEESVRIEAVDLFYRPVFAFRFKRLGKEAVVEYDALTGLTKTAGSTFEQHLGKIMEPKFLLDLGAEAANMFIPGVTVAKIVLVKGMEIAEKRRGPAA